MNYFRKLLTRPYVFYLIGVFIVIFGVWYYFRSSGKIEIETITVARAELVQEVSVTGKVKPAQSVNLGFDKGGRITRVLAKVGDRVLSGQTLVEIYNADLVSQLRETEAGLKSEEVKLEDFRNGARPLDLKIDEAKVDEARQNLADYIQDSHTKADDAIHNKVDQFFSNPRSPNPQLNFSTFSQLEADLESGRIVVENRFKVWSQSLLKINAESNMYVFSAEALENLRFIKSYLDTVAIAINALEPAPSLTQTQINGYKGDVSTARTNVNTAINNVSGAASSLKITESELSKDLAGSTKEEILIQEASVEKAKANVSNIKAQLSKTIISSPLKGVITKQDAKVGEIVTASSQVVSVISDVSFQVEANLPEADVSKVKINDSAKLTLDAYGSGVIFEAKVIAIDPAETIIEGVSTYKITLEFQKEDLRIKSGLTANIDILTEKKNGVLAVPQRAILTQNGSKIVRVERDDGRVDEVKIELGLFGSDGKVEIISGLEEGMKVIISRELN
ncbi:hypothetical protein A3H04_01510 [Candidatus Giovannonibacteria bacterium RIFCSPLOWO2_12_FULL_43_11c]|uniref:Membrane fusion protein biotin-lipoyl like domain-containing protein n=1 Tax=Candidatus Giovannonibacteria bacterium RIFCSPHIGHO2_12_FULL_43_15 TaxID=1798341 RepID=A0A1F5WND4_9BACT|nr:MAG: hypothetical protein A3F23_00015 [Candidatus Giovannonibacteria bacterium RIFCSPHIGHO2_12_FULL_43_15]OGF92113.1 MAG: hypothetical protein A3H04_01510 [Candidatus Giovannonibacteria bacterium RIFCSPLOWO2_12_FULL_43_11c]